MKINGLNKGKSMNINMVLDFISSIGFFLTGLGTIIAAIAAIIGVTGWKKQIDSDLARRLTVAIFKHRKSLLAITHPVVAEDENEFRNTEHSYWGVNGKIMMKRFGNSKQYLREMESLLYEAELRWGPGIYETYAPVYDLEVKLVGQIIQAYDEEISPKTPKTKLKKYHDANEYLKDDSLKGCGATVDIESAFRKIEDFIKDRV